MFEGIALLMVAVLLLQLLTAVAWGLGVLAMDLPRQPGLHWMAAALLGAVSLAVAMATQHLPMAWRLPPAAVLMTVNVMLLLRGMRQLLALPRRDGEALLLLAAMLTGALWSGLSFRSDGPVGVLAQAVSASLLAIWLFGRAAIDAWPRLRAEFGAAAARILVLPLLLVALIGALRLVSVMDGPPRPLPFNSPLHAPLALLILMSLMALHGAMVAMVILRLVNRLRESSQRDALTGLFNRGEWMRRLNACYDGARRDPAPHAVLLLDIDHFKRVNDGHGHPAGDEVLVRVAQTLVSASRAQDLVGRLGGEEFALLLPHTDLQAASQLAERLRLAVRDTGIVWKQQRLSVTGSIGVAVAAAQDLGPASLLERADAALYRAKHGGRNRVELAAEDSVAAPALRVQPLSAGAAAGSPGERAPSAIPTP